MANIPQLLKQAVLNQDWSKVEEAYQTLTGENITQAEPQSEGVEEKQSFIAKAHSGNTTSFSNEDGDQTQAARKEPMNIPNQGSRKPAWTDDGSVAAGEMVSKNPSLGVANPVERSRPKASTAPKDKHGDIRLDRSPKLRKDNDE